MDYKAYARASLILFGVLCAGYANAKIFTGTVTFVSDGDTLWVRMPQGGQPVKVRFQGIDAPESCQAWGPQATAALRAKTLHKEVQLNTRARDDYGRMLARVSLQGDDVGAWLVAQGHAWSYHYRRDPGPYAVQESAAKAARLGLWAQAAPVEPREFRKSHGPCK